MNNQPHILNRSSVVWPPPPENATKFSRPNFTSTNTKLTERNETLRNDPLGIRKIYKNPNQLEFHRNSRSKSRWQPKKKFRYRFAPYAPRNTSSFIIRAKKSGGITSLVSPCAVTPAILPTPTFSPSGEVLVDMAKEEWGVDGYGSMKGLIRVRSTGHDDEEEGGCETSDSDVEEMERRLDHDLSRFEMVYPNAEEQSNTLEKLVDGQDGNIVRLQEENLTLKERLFLMERELEDIRRRVRCLETGGGRTREKNDNDDEGSENGSDNVWGGDVCSEKSVGDGVGEGGG
ncbi:hypothetical protein RJ640_022290 [Escallonia rubra]|uniref:PRLI-interacting factor A n=1 Tax=Escallonia rubra TaxID=112253 RepID=A0AA88QYC9_9ASTE|nr:hypothetical protein RJ640_022290 [Escallonia rubra]